MTNSAPRIALMGAPLAIVMTLTACGSDDEIQAPPPAPPAQQTVQSVAPCLDQVVPGTGTTVLDLIVPDTITVDLSQGSGFPNGRRLEDPVIDVTLAVALLDMSVHAPDTFVNLPLNPPANDVAFRNEFPFLGLPQGNPPLSGSDTATQFAFLENPADDYVRVDRTGMPALSPALIGVPVRDDYNDAGPAEDGALVFADELIAQLTSLTDLLLDDFDAAGLTPCAQTG